MKISKLLAIAMLLFSSTASFAVISRGSIRASWSGLRSSRPIYPEYNGRFEIPKDSVAYSLPNFGGKIHYWVRYWNASGRAVDPKDNRVMSDGILYDGQFLYAPQVSADKRVHFKAEYKDPRFSGIPDNRFFLTFQVTTDPRLTNWWMSTAADPAKTLFKAVEKAALTQKFPDVTRQILAHMMNSGIVTEGKPARTPKAIREAMIEYTNLALAHNLAETRRRVAKNRLTLSMLSRLKVGDVITDYFWSRFGPYPEPSAHLEIVDVKGDEVFIKGTAGGPIVPLNKDYNFDFTALERKK